jgi:hypothetical protein
MSSAAIVELNTAKFRGMLPELSAVADDELAGYFMRAQLYIDNGETALIPNPPRESILYLTMAHLISLYKDGRGSSVGRISSASQGSVSVSFGFSPTVGGEWWQQTQYGAEVWAVTLKYRTFRWIK